MNILKAPRRKQSRKKKNQEKHKFLCIRLRGKKRKKKKKKFLCIRPCRIRRLYPQILHGLFGFVFMGKEKKNKKIKNFYASDHVEFVGYTHKFYMVSLVLCLQGKRKKKKKKTLTSLYSQVFCIFIFLFILVLFLHFLF